MGMARDLSDYLCEHRRAMVRFLERLALAESPSSEPGRQGEVLALLSGPLAEAGYRVRRVPGRRGGWHLYARPSGRRPGGPVQLLLGHCDTVWPVGTARGMPIVAGDGVVRGPGVYDMKGGLTQMVFALRALRALGLEPSVAPVVFVNSDEEVGSRDSTRHIRRLSRVAERAFVMEPSLGISGRLKTARKGVGRFSVVVRGQAAHAGLDPGRGASAILELSYMIQALFALNDPARGVTVNVGTIDGGLGPNVVAPQSRAVVDVRVPTRADARRVEEAILNLAPVTPGAKVVVEGGVGRPPMEPTPRNRRLWEAARRLGEDLGLKLEEGLAGGASDGNTASLFTATLDGLGAVGDGAHASHEFVYADRMVERCALLALLVMEPPLGRGERR
ncbi:M20/M25/M40 family metallo-hydrolase [Rubrobacter tropicus]|uniref:M20/M25/M40 family metallo-hydrolase n=1 Tax=Rubrobacter tropicus TaxID=2653851 RepID=A0A6G8QEP2_9ACTN|nr:M20 family metallopeptidase [Rubrobacter tropicus]QIN84707.1 M20/M25/M40 family metallo-hydrolase [Rubrobacter tropicus]